MVRRPRVDLPDVPQHVIQRGNNRSVCFFDDVDYVSYLRYLKMAVEKSGCEIHAYVLMANHVHLLLTGLEAGSISLAMQCLGRRYVRYINEKYQRSGTLWEGRYKSCLIDSERYLLTCYRYIEMNPVRAGVSPLPSDYYWSSHRHNINESYDPLVCEHYVYSSLGMTRELRARRYIALFENQIDSAVLEQIRFSTNKGYALGSERFTKKIEVALGRRVTPGKPGRKKKTT